jgi:hypothetical protein
MATIIRLWQLVKQMARNLEAGLELPGLAASARLFQRALAAR